MDLYELIAAVIAICGLGLLIKVLVILYFYKVVIKNWMITTGEVLKAEVVYYKSKTDADTEGWKHRVSYKYVVDGKEYFGNRITKNLGYLSPSKILTGGVKFNEGQTIEVYYNPKKPYKAVLDNNFNYNSLFLIAVSLIAFYIASLISSKQIG